MGAVFALFAAWYYWSPKIFGLSYNELAGQIHFWILFVGVNVTFLPLHFLGLQGKRFLYSLIWFFTLIQDLLKNYNKSFFLNTIFFTNTIFFLMAFFCIFSIFIIFHIENFLDYITYNLSVIPLSISLKYRNFQNSNKLKNFTSFPNGPHLKPNWLNIPKRSYDNLNYNKNLIGT